MHAIRDIKERLNDLNELSAVRMQIVDLILHHLHAHRDNLTDAEKIHLSNAIGALALNVNSLTQPTTSWLRLCLADLERALSADGSHGDGLGHDLRLEDISHESLMAAMDSIGVKLSYVKPLCTGQLGKRSKK